MSFARRIDERTGAFRLPLFVMGGSWLLGALQLCALRGLGGDIFLRGDVIARTILILRAGLSPQRDPS